MKYIAEISAEGDIVMIVGTYTAEDKTIAQREEKEASWRPASEPPADGEIVPVVTKNGVRMFAQPINGKFLGDVAYWFPLPKNPK